MCVRVCPVVFCQVLLVAKLALNAGKPVLCESPMVVNTQQLNELLECAKKNNVFLMEVAGSIIMSILCLV